jgi:hypothetical protein
VLEAEALKLCRLKITKKDAARLTDVVAHGNLVCRYRDGCSRAGPGVHRTVWEAAGLLPARIRRRLVIHQLIHGVLAGPGYRA